MLNQIKTWFSKKDARPYKLLQIEPTLQCSLACVMCPWTELRSEAGTMDLATFDALRPFLSQAKSVDLTGGGEPLLSPILLEMVQSARQAGCTVGFSTNGFRLTPDLSEHLVAAGLDWISFSVDAATPELYNQIRQGSNFDIVIANIRALKEIKARSGKKRPRMMMVFVLMLGSDSTNYHQLPAYIELAHSLGVETVIAKNLDVILKDGDDDRRLFTHNGQPLPEIEAVLGEASERAQRLGVRLRTYNLQPIEQAICEHDPVHSLYVNWQGYVSSCITLSYAENRVFNGARVFVPCQRFGNVREQSLDVIWNQPDYQAFRNIYKDRLRAANQSIVTSMFTGRSDKPIPIPDAPEGCQTCYYLFGV
jgi:MoaA/NifB/PqqE/SkfB family radical SAM enzyme